MDYKKLSELTLEQLIEEKIRRPLYRMKQSVKLWAFKNWYKIAFLGVCLYFAVQDDLNFNVNFKSKDVAAQTTPHANSQPVALNVSTISESTTSTNSEKPSNFLFGSSLFSKAASVKKEKPIVMTEKAKKQLAYVEKFAEVAVKEMKQYGIPASVTLAQGLIETNAGASSLATKNKNHFGMKCFSRKCRKGHCSNFSDDTHKDFFRIYKNAWESYRSHSELLMGKRYKHLTKLGTKNYKDWAVGLRKAGYATDKRYHNKLIQLIEDLHLYKYDE